MASSSQLNPISLAVTLLSVICALWPTGALAGSTNGNSEGYKLSEAIPVSCLNRTT